MTEPSPTNILDVQEGESPITVIEVVEVLAIEISEAGPTVAAVDINENTAGPTHVQLGGSHD